jgi:hypothetical protein
LYSTRHLYMKKWGSIWKIFKGLWRVYKDSGGEVPYCLQMKPLENWKSTVLTILILPYYTFSISFWHFVDSVINKVN